jgi:cytochrome c biogenesis protein CcmG/thiol:disulfide interchange protein DsbE
MVQVDMTTDRLDPGLVGGAPSRARGVLVATIVVLATVLVAWSAMRVIGGGALGQDPFGQVAPKFSLPRLSGNGSISLTALRGRPVVLNFWASWCAPCRDEAPVLAAAARKWKEQGVVFLGVDTKDASNAALAFTRMYGVGYPSVVDDEAILKSSYAVLGFPETFFIDAAGAIHAKYVGPINAATLDAYVAAIAKG